MDIVTGKFTSNPWAKKPTTFTIEPESELFTDVSKKFHKYEAIKFVKEKGIVSGYSDGTFRPYSNINRAEFIKIIIKSQFSQSEIDNCNSYSFKDVSSTAWYAPYVCVAKSNNIISGYSDGTFQPSKTINFAEAAKITVNAFNYSIGSDFIWYRPYINILKSKNAVPVTVQSADQNITRGEMAEVIYKLII